MFALCAVTTLDIPLTYNGDTQSILDTGIPWRSRGLTEACFWVLKKGRVGHRDLVSQWQRQFAYTLRLLKNAYCIKQQNGCCYHAGFCKKLSHSSETVMWRSKKKKTDGQADLCLLALAHRPHTKRYTNTQLCNNPRLESNKQYSNYGCNGRQC
ncbi:Methylthioribulose-1-phosphate dehydratase-like protein [Trichinella pseudospiralis]